MRRRENRYNVTSVARALDILRCFSASNPSYSLTELSRKLGIHKSTVHRLLATLEEYGFVERDPLTGHYRLGLRVLELGFAAASTLDLRREARPYLEELQKKCGETVHLAVLDRGQVVYLDKLEGQGAIRIYSQIGRRAPAHCTGLGKAMLAYLPESEVRAIIREHGLPAFTSNTITDEEELLRTLAEVRECGFARDRGEHEAPITCVAAPLLDYTRRVVGAISITCVASQTSEETMARYAELVRETAYKISRSLGFARLEDEKEEGA